MVQNNSPFKLYGPSESIQVRKCVAIANLTKVDFGHSHSKPGDESKGTFTTVSPFSLCALVTPYCTIVGSNAICHFFASTSPINRLMGRDVYESASIQGVVEVCSNTLETALLKFQDGHSESESEINKYLAHLDAILEKKTFLVGERRSYGDVAVAVVVKHVELAGIAIPQCVTRWLNTIMSDAPISKAMNTKASTGMSPRKTTPKKSTNAAEEDVVDNDTENETTSLIVDMGHPSLVAVKMEDFNKTPAPPGPISEGGINMEAWKREYSNSKTPEDFEAAFKHFWEQYNAEDYTIWKVVYDKLPGDLAMDYLASNACGMFLQAVDNILRKSSFGVFHVFGENSDFNYEGVLMLQGSEMPVLMMEHRSFEFHKWAKIDTSADEMKSFVQEYWTAEADNEDLIRGRKITATKKYK